MQRFRITSRRLFLLALLTGAGLLGAQGAPQAAPQATSKGERQLVAQTIASHVAVRSDRRAMAGGVYDPQSRQTYVCWMGKDSDPYVQAYDHATNRWSTPKKVGDAPRGDAHNYPTMTLAANGHILVFFGAHNTGEFVAESPGAHSIDGDWTTRDITKAPTASYPMPLTAENGDIYLFFRETTHDLYPDDPTKFTDDRPMEYVVSHDNGQTWQSSKDVTGQPFILGSTGRPDHMNEIYMGEITPTPSHGSTPERWHMVWTLAGGGPDVHDHDRFHQNLYYAYFQPSDHHFYDVHGRDLGVKIDNNEMEHYAKAVSTPPNTVGVGYTHLVQIQDDGRPVLVYNRQFGDYIVITAADWNGRKWVITPGPANLRLLDMDSALPNANRVYAGTTDEPGIQTYLLRNGRRWRKSQFVWTDQIIQRADVITDYREPARLVVTGDTGTGDQTVATGNVYALGTP